MSLALIGVVLAALVIVAVPGAVNPADTGTFELDGNAFADNAAANDDWNCVPFAGLTLPTTNCQDPPAPEASTHVSDPTLDTGDDILGQGSKDILDLDQWTLVTQKPPAKDDIANAAWATYSVDVQGDPNPHEIVYFTADRISNNGDAYMGFWFFKNHVSDTGGLTGLHAVGDILVLVNFIQGQGQKADTQSIGVFKWVGTGGDVNGTLQTLVPITEGACTPGAAVNACAIFNTGSVPAVFPFTSADSGDPDQTYTKSEFVEGGIDLTAILGGDDCFTSVMAETRSSSSVTAEQKDVAFGSLNTCGTIKIVKDALPDDAQDFGFAQGSGAALTPSTFNLDDDADATLSNTQTYELVKPGTYTISENANPAGWSLANISCDDATVTPSSGDTGTRTATINVSRNETVTCTFTNAKAPKLHLRKVVVNDNGGTKTLADFTLTADGTGSNDLSGTSPVDSGASLAPDTWTLSETNVPGYTASAWNCVGGSQSGSQITLTAGQEATCTITNDDVAPKLTLNKVVVNDNGGTAAESDWTLTATGNPATNPASFSGPGAPGSNDVVSPAGLDAGTYDLSESAGPAGYAASTWSCTGGQTGTQAKVTVAAGDDITCTITNNDIAPKLHLRKVVVNDNGGTKTVADFTLTANGAGSNDLSGTSPVDSGATLQADTWTLSESSVAGYTASDWACVGGSQNGNQITVGLAGEATCTITNDDIAPKLHLRKVVVNDNGGTKTTADFALTADGTGANDLSGHSPVDSDSTLKADTWTLSEATLAGYTASDWVCVGGQQAGNHVTLGVGEEATCTIENDDIAPKLHLRKVVVNDNGGTATTADFTLTANGTGSNDLSGTSPVDSGSTLQADTWTLSETTLAGYTASDWVCVGGSQNGNEVTVGIAGEATCTITNNDIAPKLHLRKVVVNDNGGSKTVADFTLTADGTAANDLSGTSPVDSGATLKADTWTLSESSVAGYTASDWVCVGGQQATNHVTLGVGEEATCTIENDDVPPKLHLRKVVVNDNGGTKTVADFTLTADGTGSNDLSGTSPVDSGSTLQADTWTLSESSVAGYTASDWVCVGGSQDGNKITLVGSEEATCTITNDDVAPKLHLRKVVENDNGGTATTADFTLTADGTAANDLSGTSPVDSGATLKADTWALSETTLPGYTASDWVCVGGQQAGSNVTLGVGDEATCTITNNDVGPSLHLRKVVINDNGGTATTADFTLTANGAGSNDISGTSPVDSNNLKADTFTLSETTLAGYTASDWVCVGGSQNGNQITLGLTDDATCTITNDDIAPKLHLRKVVVNDNGGTKTVADFTLTANGTGENDLSGTSPVDSGATLKADTWALSETSVPGYTAGAWACVGGQQAGSNVTLGVGEEATCTIENNDVAPKLTVNKICVPVTDTGKFNLQVDGQTAGLGGEVGCGGSTGTISVSAGAHTVGETAGTGTTLSDYTSVIGGDCAPDGSVTLQLTDSKTCTITNTRKPKLTVNKVCSPANDSGKFNLQVDAANFGTGANAGCGGTTGAQFVSIGSHSVGETAGTGTNLNDYTSAIGGACAANGSVTLAAGDNKVCTITNTHKVPPPPNPTLTVNKVCVPATSDRFNLQVDGSNFGTGANAACGGTTGAVEVSTGTHTVGETAGTNTSLANYTTTIGGDCAANGSVTLSAGENKTCTITNTLKAAGISIQKNPDEQSIRQGTSATWTIVVTNTGAVTLTNVTVTDALAPGCDRTSAAIPALASMAPGASVTYTCSRPNVTTSFTNVAVATGTPPAGANVTANDSAHVTVTVPLKPPTPVKRVLHPAITIQKNPNSQTVSRGGIATFEITVTNNGDVTLRKVTVTDPRAPGCKHRIGTLAPGKSVTYTCTKPKLKQGFRNVARVVGTAPNGKKVRDNDDAIVKVAPLKPAKIIKKKPKPKPKVISKVKPKVTG